MKYEKNIRIQSCSFQKDLQVYIFLVSISTNTIKIQEFHFLEKIYDIHKKRLDEKLFA